MGYIPLSAGLQLLFLFPVLQLVQVLTGLIQLTHNSSFAQDIFFIFPLSLNFVFSYHHLILRQFSWGSFPSTLNKEYSFILTCWLFVYFWVGVYYELKLFYYLSPYILSCLYSSWEVELSKSNICRNLVYYRLPNIVSYI